jgi:hypothetical protein
MSEQSEANVLIWKKFTELVQFVLESKRKEWLGKGAVDKGFRCRAVQLIVELVGLGGTGPIVTVQRHLAETVRVSNRVVSFVLDGNLHIGTGMLVGPCHVLTAAHLFFGRHGALIDAGRLNRITVEVHKTCLGQIIIEGDPPQPAKLYSPETDDWLIEPGIKNGVAQRDVDYLDFVIVRIADDFGNDSVGTEKRGWFEIPTAHSAEILAKELPVQVFMYLNRKNLLTASGFVRDVTQDGYRVLHTASTKDSASGAPLLDDDFKLVAMHLGGSASGELPRSNRGLPIRRVAEVIDKPRCDGSTVRALLGSCPEHPPTECAAQ